MIQPVGVPEDEGQGLSLRMDVPEEQRGGEYANILAVWHTAHEFTLDFAATQPPQRTDPNDENSPFVVPCHVVSRVRIPVSVVFDVLRALNENMTRYENVFGEIQRPQQRDDDAEA
jgi:hypothetical protein